MLCYIKRLTKANVRHLKGAPMMKRITRLGLCALAFPLFAASTRAEEHAAAPPTPPPAVITFVPAVTPSDAERAVLERYIAHATAHAAGLTREKVAAQCAESPEMFAWVDFPYLDALLDACALTGDSRHLETFRTAFALYSGLLETGDDGFKGWYGKPIPPRRQADRPDLRIDELQMNFRAVAILSRWVELARRQPEYAKARQATVDEYLELMEKQLFPKWEGRGFFADLGKDGGVYRGLDYPLNNPAEPGVTLSHEKISILVDGLLGLYRVTGNGTYMRRAIQLGTRFKHCLTLKDGHYEWMSWDPAGKWDASRAAGKDAWAIGWIAPDPRGEWYAAAVSIALNLYQHGVVFDDTDLARFVATQKNRCWNGDMTAPVYRTVAGIGKAESKHVQGQFLSHLTALYDPELSQLAFAGPHEAEIAARSANAWGGCVGIAPYVRAKYLLRPLVAAGQKQPFARYGEAFLADPANRAFAENLRFSVTAPGRVTPLKPSQMPGLAN